MILEVDGNHMYKSGGRFFILTKVGNGHVPFYSSSRGTSGKNKGGWYPYFGLANYEVSSDFGSYETQ